MMKIAIECKSPLLQKSLELFLAKYLNSAKHSDIIVRDDICEEDDERCFCISSEPGSDLAKPFSKSQLILALEDKYKQIKRSDVFLEYDGEQPKEPLDFDILEKRIDFLTKEYKQNILKAVKAFYED